MSKEKNNEKNEEKIYFGVAIERICFACGEKMNKREIICPYCGISQIK